MKTYIAKIPSKVAFEWYKKLKLFLSVNKIGNRCWDDIVKEERKGKINLSIKEDEYSITHTWLTWNPKGKIRPTFEQFVKAYELDINYD